MKRLDNIAMNIVFTQYICLLCMCIEDKLKGIIRTRILRYCRELGGSTSRAFQIIEKHIIRIAMIYCLDETTTLSQTLIVAEL